MRIIKFRGKRVTDNTWVYGCLVNNLWTYNEHHSFYGNPVCEIITGKYDGDCWEDVAQDEENSIVAVIPESVGEYTGLKDKNGKDIYEGDIMVGTYGGTSYQMNWKGCLHGISRLGTKLSCDIPQKIERDFTIIGNIYETPELINS